MKGELGLRVYDKDTGNIIPGARIAVQDGRITVFSNSVDVTSLVTVKYCCRVLDYPGLMFSEVGYEHIGIRSA